MPKRTGECGDDQSDHGGPKKPKRSGGLGVHLQGSPPFSEGHNSRFSYPGSASDPDYKSQLKRPTNVAHSSDLHWLRMDCWQNVQTRRCENIFGDESNHGKTNFGDGPVVEEGFFHAAVRKCGDGQNGGSDGQGQNTTSNPPKTASSGTQSTGTSTPTTSMDSGVGGSEPPGGGRGNPPIPGHYSDHQGEAESNGENPGNNAGVTCDGCRGQPKSVKVFFTSEDTGDVRTVKGVYCSQKCAENGRTGSQVVFFVNLWDTESSSSQNSSSYPFRCCPVCLDFEVMPLTVCLECGAFMCAICGHKSHIENKGYRCPNRCPASRFITVVLPACIAGPAHLTTVDLAGPVLADQSGEANMMFGLSLYVWLVCPVLHRIASRLFWLFRWIWPVNEQRERAESHQRLLLEEQSRRHRRQQDDENRRLEEANHPQGSFPEAVEDQGSRLLVDELEFGTASGPPTEEYQAPTEDVEQETYDPVVEEDLLEQESTQPQEVPNILPALKESEVTDDDDGFEETSTE